MKRKHIIAFMIMMLSTSWAGYALAGSGTGSDVANASTECASPTASNGYVACTGTGIGGAIVDADVGSGHIVAMRSDPGSATHPIDAFGTCRYIDNSTTNSYFVPFRSSDEWTHVKSAATSFTQVHCSRPYTQSSGYSVSPPPYGGCTALTSFVTTPQVYARYPGGSAQTGTANFSCNSGSTSVTADEVWGGLDSDNGYTASWAPLKTLYGPNVVLSSGGKVGSVDVDVGTTAILSWTATSSTGANVSCTPAPWGATSSSAGSASITPSAIGSSNYSITCLDSYSGLTSTATITVNGLAAVTAAISANPSTILVGSPTTLTWSSSNAASCTINNGVSTGGATSGSVSGSPAITTTYTVTCSNSGGSASQSTTITVDQPVSSNLTGSPTTILTGTNSLLAWSSSNATSCSINNGIGPVAVSGSRTISPGTTTTYTLTCSNPVNTSSQSTIITVDGQVAVNISALPTTILAGRTTNLSWSSTNATSCSIDQMIGSVAIPSSSMNVSPASTTTYTLTCSNPVSTASQVVTITVDQPVSATLTPSPSTIVSGSSSTLNWSSTNATSCTLGGSVVGLTGSTVVSPTTTTNYTLICSNAADSATQTTTVTVVQPVAASFSASPTTIALAASSTLTWSPSNATTCTIDNGIGSVAATGGSQSVSPTTTTTYSLTCNDGLSGAGSSVVRTATVTVCPSGYSVVGGVCVMSSLCIRSTAILGNSELAGSMEHLSGNPIVMEDNNLSPSISSYNTVKLAVKFSYDKNYNSTCTNNSSNFTGSGSQNWFSYQLCGDNSYGTTGNNNSDGFGFGLLFNGATGSDNTPSPSNIWDITGKPSGYRIDTGWQVRDNIGDNRYSRYTATIVPCANPTSVAAQSCPSGTFSWGGNGGLGTGYDGNGAPCTASVSAGANGQTQSLVQPNSGGINTAKVECVDGQWGGVNGTLSCQFFCPAGVVTSCWNNNFNVGYATAGNVYYTSDNQIFTCIAPSNSADTGYSAGGWTQTSAGSCPVDSH